MGLSFSKKGEFQAGHPWKNPEETFYSAGGDKFAPDYIPPNISRQRPFYDPSPLYRPAHHPTETSLHDAKLRAEHRDCISYTLDVAKYPAVVGLAWGATLASFMARPDIRTGVQPPGVVLAGKGLLKELKFLKSPVVALGGYAALYAAVECSTGKFLLDSGDGVLASALAGGITGTTIGLHLRSSNYMFVGGFWGAALAAILKWAWMEETLLRPRKTYYERVDARKRMSRPEYAEKMAVDGLMHKYLQPGLRSLGLEVPESWEENYPK